MNLAPIDRIGVLLESCGLLIYPVHDALRTHESVPEVEVSASGDDLFRLRRLFHAPAADVLWMTLAQVESVCERYIDLVEKATPERWDTEQYASPAEAETLWRMLTHAAAQNAHVSEANDPACPCHGCNCQRQFWAARAAAKKQHAVVRRIAR